MLEQEMASIIRFTLDKAGNPPPYYHEVPEGFLIPSVYFPPPEITSSGDTFRTYALRYTWFIKFFHLDAVRAYGLAFSVLDAIRAERNLVQLIDTKGKDTGRGFRIEDPTLKPIDGSPAAAQLTVSWNSPRPYNDPEVPKMVTYELDIHTKTAYEKAVEQVSGGEPQEP